MGMTTGKSSSNVCWGRDLTWKFIVDMSKFGTKKKIPARTAEATKTPGILYSDFGGILCWSQ